jgi:rhodanese-related sulfurtransferase
MTEIPQISPSILPDDHAFLILDVRERSEWNYVHLPGALHLPLGELSQRYKELPSDRELLLLCHHGMRSQRAAEFLKQKGFTVNNLAGGIDRWAIEKDAELKRY